MYSFRRFAVLLALLLPASIAIWAEGPGNSLESSSQAQAQAGEAQPQAPAPAAAGTQSAQATSGQASVEARIRARREQRRAQAIHDTYSHLYELFVGSNYQRFTPGPYLQHATMYSWDAAVTRYLNERLGVTFEGRGNYGTAYVGLNSTSVTRPAISHYDALVGPTYRFIMRPKYSIAGRAMGGVAIGNFSGDTNGFGTHVLGLYPDGPAFAFNVAVIGEVNLAPNLSLRLAPEYFASGFGSTLQNDWGATYGIVYRFGK
jgi:hypothetical protein